MIEINATLDSVFSLGLQGENGYRQINFDITDLLADMDLTGAEVVCMLKRPEQAPIICNDFAYDLTEKTAVLTVTSTETAYAGRCKLELDLVIDDVVGKTQIYTCNVVPSISATCTCETVTPWVAEVLSASASAEASANSASASATEAQNIADSLTSTIGTAVEEYLEDHPISVPVDSVNGKTGAVVLSASDVGALDDGTSYVSSFNGASGAITYTAPVTSVNSKTGAVALSASDVGALASSTSYVSSFNGSTGAVTYTAPVTSVNGSTGAVTISVPSKASDITNDSAVTGTNVDDALDTLNTQITSIYPTATVSGSVATFTDGADSVPVKDLTISIEPVQSGSGDPAPNNVRPITGWTGVTLSHSDADTSNPTTLTIDWTDTAGTVYGGTLDVTTGVLTVDMAVVDLGTLTWVSFSANGRTAFRAMGQIDGVPVSGGTGKANALCTQYNVVQNSYIGDTLYDNVTAVGAYWASGCNVYIYDSAKTSMTLAQFKTAMNGVQLVYELATPVTYQLTAQEVKTLLGTNNIWADTGSVSVTYRANLQAVYDDYQSAISALGA